MLHLQTRSCWDTLDLKEAPLDSVHAQYFILLCWLHWHPGNTANSLWPGCYFLACVVFLFLTFLWEVVFDDFFLVLKVLQVCPVVPQGLSCCLLHSRMLVFLQSVEGWNGTGRCINDCEIPGQNGHALPGFPNRATLEKAWKPSLGSVLYPGWGLGQGIREKRQHSTAECGDIFPQPRRQCKGGEILTSISSEDSCPVLSARTSGHIHAFDTLLCEEGVPSKPQQPWWWPGWAEACSNWTSLNSASRRYMLLLPKENGFPSFSVEKGLERRGNIYLLLYLQPFWLKGHWDSAGSQQQFCRSSSRERWEAGIHRQHFRTL